MAGPGAKGQPSATLHGDRVCVDLERPFGCRISLTRFAYQHCKDRLRRTSKNIIVIVKMTHIQYARLFLWNSTKVSSTLEQSGNVDSSATLIFL